jgi:DNA adenine methylase
MKPFFKWAGGKTKELPKIKKYLPKNIETFYEPFAGGGAVWLNINHSPSIVNDSWFEVYNFYQQLKLNGDRLKNELQRIILEYNNFYHAGITKDEFSENAGKMYYYWRNTKFDDNFNLAIRFWILRQLSFSGMNRFNAKGEYNVPFGWYKKLRSFDLTDEVKNLIDNTEFKNSDFEDALSNVQKGDFVFLDPPYTTVFNKYSPEGTFTEEHQIRLSEWFKNSPSNNMIIINKDEFTESLYEGYIVEEYDYKYSIKVKDRISKNDSKSVHILAINYNIE